jgi:CRISPR-associated protein Cmr4
MTTMLFIEALSPIHSGTGQAAGAVDLPIARERATRYPYIPGSSLKGSLRARAEQTKDFPTTKLFGPETNNASDWAGSAAFCDASLLLMPVRSMAGTFALATSPLALLRLARDAKAAGQLKLSDAAASAAQAAQKMAKDRCLVSATNLCVKVDNTSKVILEDFDLGLEKDPADGTPAVVLATALGTALYKDQVAWQNHLKSRLCVVHDDLFGYLIEHGTDVVTRVSIDRETNTAKGGQLWTEENLPTGTVLVSLLDPMANAQAGLGNKEVPELVAKLVLAPVQLGGKATVGRGRCHITVLRQEV